jgi:hypothetical protein
MMPLLCGNRRCLMALPLLLGWPMEAQTNCATRHLDRGVFICYPNPSENSADRSVSDVFHLSAQGNAREGQAIAGYKVTIDNRTIYETTLAAPIQALSLETNLKSPFESGSHQLRVEMKGAGAAEVGPLQFRPSENASFCDPFIRTSPRVCYLTNLRGPVQWTAAGDAFGTYLALYGQNLKSFEADIADAMAVDRQGNLYIALHAFGDVELRKYAPNGSLTYSSVIPSCGDGFLSVAGLAIDDTGRAWIAGNSRCGNEKRMRGFVMLADTTKPTSVAPLFMTYVSEVESRIAAIRVDREGNAYVTGTTTSEEFQHQSFLSIGESADPMSLSFVSVLMPSGSGLLWSSLLRNAELTSLALDSAGNVYVTGKAGGEVLVAWFTDRGRKLSYVGRFSGSPGDEARGISTTGDGAWIFVAGGTFMIALQPCKTDGSLVEFDHLLAPAIALTPALDAYASTVLPGSRLNQSRQVRIAHTCPSINH